MVYILILDRKSTDFLVALYDCAEITVADANKLTGYDESVSNPVTGTLLRQHYIEYVPGEYMMNTAGQWVDVNSSFCITPEGRAYIESMQGQDNANPVERQDDDNEAKKIYRLNQSALFWTAVEAIVAIAGIVLTVLMHSGII